MKAGPVYYRPEMSMMTLIMLTKMAVMTMTVMITNMAMATKMMVTITTDFLIMTKMMGMMNMTRSTCCNFAHASPAFVCEFLSGWTAITSLLNRNHQTK